MVPPRQVLLSVILSISLIKSMVRKSVILSSISFIKSMVRKFEAGNSCHKAGTEEEYKQRVDKYKKQVDYVPTIQSVEIQWKF